MSKRRKRSPARDVHCPVCSAPIGHACEERGQSCAPHPKRLEAAYAVKGAARQQHSRKTGNAGTRLTYTAAPTAEMRAKERAIRKPKPVETSHKADIVHWWLTPARRGSFCDECGEPVPKGSAIAYRHFDQRAVCELCVDRLGIVPKPSKAWHRALQSALSIRDA